MHVSSFSNNLEGESLHTNEYAAGTSSSQSFVERRSVEQNRQTIGAYRHSQLGANFVAHGEYARPKAHKFTPKDTHHSPSRQAIGSDTTHEKRGTMTPTERPATEGGMKIPSRQQFHEPTSRGYNPYG